jgi:hypothetical protein
MTQTGVLRNQILLPSVFGPKRPWDQEIAAGTFGGRAHAILEANEKYWMSFWYMVTKGLKVCYEQRVMVTMCRTWPDLCSIHYYSGRDGDWFVMGRYWLRNPGFDFSNNGAVLGNSTNESLFADNCCRGACRLPSRRIVDNGRNCSPTIWTKMNIHRTIEQPMDSQSQIIMYYHRSWH